MTSEYNRWPDKAGPSRRHFGRAVDRSILTVGTCCLKSKTYSWVSSCGTTIRFLWKMLDVDHFVRGDCFALPLFLKFSSKMSLRTQTFERESSSFFCYRKCKIVNYCPHQLNQKPHTLFINLLHHSQMVIIKYFILFWLKYVNIFAKFKKCIVYYIVFHSNTFDQ